MANDASINSGTDPVEPRLFLDGTNVNGIFRPQPGGRAPAPATARYKRRDRVWSGHYMKATATNTTPIAVGWHNMEVRIWSQAPTFRVRIRNFKYWFTK